MRMIEEDTTNPKIIHMFTFNIKCSGNQSFDKLKKRGYS
jgi:hypothetical protein